jgi:hypothetical protein
MPLTPRLAEIIAAMVTAKLDTEATGSVASGVRIARARTPDPDFTGRAPGSRRRGRR